MNTKSADERIKSSLYFLKSKESTKLDDKNFYLNGSCRTGNFPQTAFSLSLCALSAPGTKEPHELEVTKEYHNIFFK